MKQLYAATIGLSCIALSLATIYSPKHTQIYTRPKYNRVVSLAPSFSHTMVALNQSHRMVGVTNHCDEPSLAKLPRIGTFAQANFEAILRLKPDLILAVPHAMAMGLLNQLADLGIEIYLAQPDSIKDIKNINRELATKFNIINQGDELNQRLEQAISQAKLAMKNFGLKNILMAISSTPLVVAGHNSFPDQVARELGLINTAQISQSPWPIWPLEKIISEPPDIFIVTEGPDRWGSYVKLFANLGIDTDNSSTKFIVPARPLFESPSPLLIDDIKYFTTLLLGNL